MFLFVFFLLLLTRVFRLHFIMVLVRLRRIEIDRHMRTQHEVLRHVCTRTPRTAVRPIIDLAMGFEIYFRIRVIDIRVRNTDGRAAGGFVRMLDIAPDQTQHTGDGEGEYNEFNFHALPLMFAGGTAYLSDDGRCSSPLLSL